MIGEWHIASSTWEVKASKMMSGKGPEGRPDISTYFFILTALVADFNQYNWNQNIFKVRKRK